MVRLLKPLVPGKRLEERFRNMSFTRVFLFLMFLGISVMYAINRNKRKDFINEIKNSSDRTCNTLIRNIKVEYGQSYQDTSIIVILLFTMTGVLGSLNIIDFLY